MNPLNIGKQDAQFGWFSSESGRSLKNDALVGSSLPLLDQNSSSSSWTISSVSQPLHEDLIENSQLTSDQLNFHLSPKEPSRIQVDLISLDSPRLCEQRVEVLHPLSDHLSYHLSPREPSLIRNALPSDPLHIGHKHSHPVDDQLLADSLDSSTQGALDLPLKRQKMDLDVLLLDGDLRTSTELGPDQIRAAFGLGTDFRDYNTVSGTDLVDFWFSSRTPSDIIALEEAERKDRVLAGPNPVLTGRMFAIQQEFLRRVNNVPTSTLITEKALEVVDSLSNLKNDLKSTIIEKSHDLIDSAKDAFNMHPLTRTLDQIAEEVKTDSSRGLPLDAAGDAISFVWPRVSRDFVQAEVLARSERIAKGINADLAEKWRHINAQIRDQAVDKMTVLGFAKDVASDALQWSAGFIGHLRTSAKHAFDAAPKSIAEIEEEEKVRRAYLVVDPIVDARKRHVERELIKSVNAM